MFGKDVHGWCYSMLFPPNMARIWQESMLTHPCETGPDELQKIQSFFSTNYRARKTALR